ncbi:MAG TPA: hypothetical protein VIT91_16725 [Chthoniobacterales bacterium]
MADKVYAETDLNHDGKVTAAEFVDHILKVSFTRLDADKDGKITPSEWALVEKGSSAKADFAALDIDKDGAVEVTEFVLNPGKREVLGKIFLTVDPNDDGVLTVKEIPANEKN